MASRTVTFAEWMKLVVRHAREPLTLNKVTGKPAVDAADYLKVSRQRVHQLVEAGVLDTLVVTTKGGKVHSTLITLESLERYVENRVPDVRGRQGYFSWPEQTA